VLHKVGGRAMLDRAIDAALELGCERIVVVVGAHSPQVGAHVIKRLGEGSTALQDPPLGTGHAVLAAKGALEGFTGDVVVTYADCPLLDAAAIEPLFDLHDTGADLAVLGFEASDPGAYGRLILGEDGALRRIVEAKEASEEELAVTACNSGVLAADAGLLFELLAEVRADNAKGEYYLTDVAALAAARGLAAVTTFAPESAVMGVNSQGELAAAEAAFQAHKRRILMADGVSMSAPETVHLSWDTEIAGGVVIEPYVVFGPGARVEAGAQIRAFSHIEGAVVRPGAIVGPYARLRPGADIGPGAHVGNFVEVKNVTLGAGAKANHLSYLGDGAVGAGANIGAGTIFCNYDGFDKARTEIGEGAFIGSNTLLVAPITVGDRAITGTGSVITQNVEADALALGRARQTVKPGWAKAFRALKASGKAKP
jgi:bifunctional UDP-N-acetylglucosamine pyrophosphorylase/glucosamine-1-phosphate N-acetyltransferase